MEFLTFNEVAKILRVSRPTLLKLIKTGEVKGIKLGRDWRFKKEDFIKGE